MCHEEEERTIIVSSKLKPAQSRAHEVPEGLGLFFPFFCYMFPLRGSHVSQKIIQINKIDK